MSFPPAFLLVSTARRAVRPPTARPGVSFVELLFTVMIMGIGFIMIAAMFPIAIRQTRSTAEETAAASVGRAGVDMLAQVASDTIMPSTARTPAKWSAPPNTSGVIPGLVVSLRDARFTQLSPLPQLHLDSPPKPPKPQQVWAALAGNLILSSDPRYAWVPLYRRDKVYAVSPVGPNWGTIGPMDATFAQVIIIAVQCQTHSFFNSNDLQRQNGYPAALEPVLATANLTRGDPSTISFSFANRDDLGRLAENTFIIVSNDNGSGLLNGRIFRLGNPLPASDGALPSTWELAPDFGLTSKDPAQISAASVFLVGRGYADPLNPAAGFIGPTQDVAVYTAFVPVHSD